MSKKIVRATMLDGTTQRVLLQEGRLVCVGWNQRRGVSGEGIYYLPLRAAFILHTDSCWGSSNNDGTTVGYEYREVDAAEADDICQREGATEYGKVILDSIIPVVT